ncbi:MAG: exonuclease domain-containing protein [Calditrichia bacterium]
MFAIVDVETTGLRPRRDRIIEIAIIITDGDIIIDSFSTLVNPQRALPAEIASLTGIKAQRLLDAPQFFQIAKRIVEMTTECVLVAHNARFDYSFLKYEFKRLGFHFQRKQICTMRLSRKLVADLPNYRLKHICKHLNISLNDAHRAERDAQATFELFQQLNAIRDDYDAPHVADWKETRLPPGIERRQVEALPEDTGVYFFREGEKLLYVGKSISIRKRVMSHFSNDLKSSRALEMKNRIREITWQVTGSEIVALLLESDLIKTLKPRYNRSQRRTKYRYGLFHDTDDAGYRVFTIELLSKNNDVPLISFNSKPQGEAFVTRMADRFELCQKHCSLQKTNGACFYYHLKTCKGACIGEEAPSDYNRRFLEAYHQLDYPLATFFVVEPGRKRDERTLILVENGSYRGFGFCPRRALKREPERLKRYIEPREDNQDVRRLLLGYLRRTKRVEVLPFGQALAGLENSTSGLNTPKNFINLASL